MKDVKSAKKSLREEKKAVKDYCKRKKEAKDKDLIKAYGHAIPEEKEHARMFRKVVKKGKKK